MGVLCNFFLYFDGFKCSIFNYSVYIFPNIWRLKNSKYSKSKLTLLVKATNHQLGGFLVLFLSTGFSQNSSSHTKMKGSVWLEYYIHCLARSIRRDDWGSKYGRKMLGCVLFRGCSCFYAAEDYWEGVFPVEALERLTEEACRRTETVSAATQSQSDEKRANLHHKTFQWGLDVTRIFRMAIFIMKQIFWSIYKDSRGVF